MKNFQFSLDSVMEWRRTRVQIEEATLERLYAEVRGIQSAAMRLRLERSQSEKTLFAAASVTGAELAALDDFKRWVAAECARLEAASADCHKRIGAQVQTVVQKRRDLRLLERLRETQLAQWKKDLAKEIDQQAEELNLRKLAKRD